MPVSAPWVRSTSAWAGLEVGTEVAAAQCLQAFAPGGGQLDVKALLEHWGQSTQRALEVAWEKGRQRRDLLLHRRDAYERHPEQRGCGGPRL